MLSTLKQCNKLYYLKHVSLNSDKHYYLLYLLITETIKYV